MTRRTTFLTARLLAVVVPVAASELPAGAFGDRAALKAAVDLWMADAGAAQATHGSIPGWDTSRVDDMSGCCYEGSKGCPSSCSGLFPSTFNEAIGGWDTSKVTNMQYTFGVAEAFNSELVWDTSKVTTMKGTFYGATAFNSQLTWDTSKVASIYGTFAYAEAFNSELPWDTSKVTKMESTFAYAEAFNSELAWDTSAVTNMFWTFYSAKAFNQALAWDTSAVTAMSNTFFYAEAFNQPSLSHWDVAAVESFEQIFYGSALASDLCSQQLVGTAWADVAAFVSATSDWSGGTHASWVGVVGCPPSAPSPPSTPPWARRRRSARRRR